MIYTYNECIKKYGSYYAFSLAIKNKEIFRVKSGVYSTHETASDLEVFVKTHSNAIFTMESAFYYLGISDTVPDRYYISTNRDATKYKSNDKIKQFFVNDKIQDLGVILIKRSNVDIKVYGKERMLIELIRYKNKMPFDYYKETIRYYREHIDEIDMSAVLKYVDFFPKKNLILNALMMEVL